MAGVKDDELAKFLCLSHEAGGLLVHLPNLPHCFPVTISDGKEVESARESAKNE
jgi:hypothetical protein